MPSQTGMLREGMEYILPCHDDTNADEPSTDGIHIDMDHLKKGEVK